MFMRLWSLAIALLLSASLQSAQAAEFDSKEVKRLTAANFDGFLSSSEKATVMTFFAPWCGHCKRLAPEYQRAAKNMKNLVNFAAIDCDDSSNRAVCARYDIKGFPTIKTFPGKKRKSSTDYMGERTAKALADHAADIMPSNARRLKSPEELTLLLDEPRDKPIALLMTNAMLVTPLYKALSSDISDLAFHVIRDKGNLDELKERLGVFKVPSVMVLQPNEDKPTFFDGDKMNYDNLYHFFSSHKQGSTSQKRAKDEL